MGLSSRLSCRVILYGPEPARNAFGERDGQGGTAYSEATHRLTLRTGSVPDLRTGMYFQFQGQRYDFCYSLPNYKRRDRLEVYCRLAVGR